PLHQLLSPATGCHCPSCSSSAPSSVSSSCSGSQPSSSARTGSSAACSAGAGLPPRFPLVSPCSRSSTPSSSPERFWNTVCDTLSSILLHSSSSLSPCSLS